MIDIASVVGERYPFWRQWHPFVLKSKGVDGELALLDAISVDIASSLIAVDALRTGRAPDIVSQLGLSHGTESTIAACLAGQGLDHLGFRIHGPMDVYLEGLPAWVAEKGWTITGLKRFAPSARFQQRVGSTAEMAQVWLEIDGDRTVELELFDIHTVPAGDRKAMAAAASGVLRDGVGGLSAHDWVAFVTDDIWHYGVLLEKLDDVDRVHAALVGEASPGIALQNESVVVNRWHGSHHTKVAGDGHDIEVEFLSYIQDWSSRA